MQKLKPCPNCGGTNIQTLACTQTYRCRTCKQCGVNINIFLRKGYEHKEAAVMAWNALPRKEEGVKDNGTEKEDSSNGS